MLWLAGATDVGSMRSDNMVAGFDPEFVVIKWKPLPISIIDITDHKCVLVNGAALQANRIIWKSDIFQDDLECVMLRRLFLSLLELGKIYGSGLTERYIPRKQHTLPVA